MSKKIFSVGLLLSVIGLLAVAGCSSDDSNSGGGASFSCSDKGPCPNDEAPTASEVDLCNQIANDAKCGGKFKELGACAKAHPICDAQGKSQKDAPECKQLNDDLGACLTGG